MCVRVCGCNGLSGTAGLVLQEWLECCFTHSLSLSLPLSPSLSHAHTHTHTHTHTHKWTTFSSMCFSSMCPLCFFAFSATIILTDFAQSEMVLLSIHFSCQHWHCGSGWLWMFVRFWSGGVSNCILTLKQTLSQVKLRVSPHKKSSSPSSPWCIGIVYAYATLRDSIMVPRMDLTLAVSQWSLLKRRVVSEELKWLLRDVNSCFHWICLCAVHSHKSSFVVCSPTSKRRISFLFSLSCRFVCSRLQVWEVKNEFTQR